MLENEQVPTGGDIYQISSHYEYQKHRDSSFIIMVSTMPLAVESERPWAPQNASAPSNDRGEEVLTWVTRRKTNLFGH